MSDWERGLAASTAFDHDRRNIADRILRARYAGSEAGITLWILCISYGVVCERCLDRAPYFCVIFGRLAHPFACAEKNTCSSRGSALGRALVSALKRRRRHEGPRGRGLSSRIFFNLRRTGSLFGFWIFSTKYPLGVPVGVGDLPSNRISTAPDHAWGRGALKSTALGF